MRKSTIFCFLVATIATMVFSSSIGLAKEKGKTMHLSSVMDMVS